MTSVNITQPAKLEYQDIKQALRTPKAQQSFRDEVKKQIDFLKNGDRLGRLFAKAGPTAREIVLRDGKIIMRYDERKAGVIEIFEFLFSKNNR